MLDMRLLVNKDIWKFLWFFVLSSAHEKNIYEKNLYLTFTLLLGNLYLELLKL